MTEQENNKNTQQEQNNKKPQDHSGIKMEGHIKIWDPSTGEVIVDKRYDNSATNKDTTRNKMEIRHTAGNKYTDIVVTCTLDYGEPTGQEAFDNTTNFNGDFVFDELGLKSWEGTENGTSNKLLTHVIFHPVQKSLNRLIQIDYTLRIQSLTTFTE